ncbi:MBL fold metallo-hydrolase [Clostridium sp. DSM 100503]|uniref:ComEC/Rec2 family competence protein n=1 Tax=Clostridium sp. DSM 100503 TaxID=2963282 RepID=UPI00214A4EF3|nr:MBL fold metallo-hydrolase [Clostridium sp. DSM 100503]MCR1951599.1 MBL fold metallo-hydrolase [Clostridium sp. DSM 100503]
MKGFKFIFLFIIPFFTFTSCDVEVEELKEIDIYFFNVGKADSILIKSNEVTILIDTARDEKGDYIVERIKDLGVEKLDYMIITHLDKDHVGGADKILEKVEVGKIFTSYVNEEKKQYREMVEVANKKNIEIAKVEVEEKIFDGDLKVEVLAPKDNYINENENSIVLNVRYGKNKFLFTGDIEENATEELLRDSKIKNHDLLKIPHHGRNNDFMVDFLAKVKPEFSIITTDNVEHTPSKKLMQALENIKSNVLITGDGEIHVTSNGIKINIEQ